LDETIIARPEKQFGFVLSDEIKSFVKDLNLKIKIILSGIASNFLINSSGVPTLL
jgi:hypothetical protein